MKAKKHLGQNFLQSKKIVARMVGYGGVCKEDTVVEIGPGKGILTEALLGAGAKVVAIEKDKELIPLLQDKFRDYIEDKKLTIVEQDVLSFKMESISKEPFRVVANIPYYITGEILRYFLETTFKPTSMTLLVQKEVAQRIVANDKKESILSLSIKIFGNPSIKEIVKRSMFKPSPNVDSAIIHIDAISDIKLAKANITPALFFKIIKLGLSQKRKTLVKNLSPLNKSEILKKFLTSIGKNEKVRGEDLGLEEWISIVKILNS